jgi:hypothetical protein
MLELSPLDITNICSATLMAIVCVIAHERAQSSGDRAFCILFGLQWVCLSFVYLALGKYVPRDCHNYWLPQCIDLIGSTMLLAGSYALYMGEVFTPHDERFKNVFRYSIIVILLTALFGLVSNRVDVPAWHVFAMSASQMLGCTSILVLGYVGGRRLPDFRLAIYLLCFYYALLQAPAYFAFFVQPILDQRCPVQPRHPEADFLEGALAGGKIVFVIYALAISGALKTGKEKSVGWILLVVNLALSIGLALFKISELLSA